MVLSLLVALRDFLVALALAWVGISVGDRGSDNAACRGGAEFCAEKIHE